MLEEMAVQVERSPRRTFVDPEATWCARERRGRPVGGRLDLPGRGERLLAVAVVALAVLAPWLV